MQLSSVSCTVIGTHWSHVIMDIVYSESSRPISGEMSAYWKYVAGIPTVFFRYVHFVVMWKTFRMDILVHNEHTMSDSLTLLVQLKHVLLLFN